MPVFSLDWNTTQSRFLPLLLNFFLALFENISSRSTRLFLLFPIYLLYFFFFYFIFIYFSAKPSGIDIYLSPSACSLAIQQDRMGGCAPERFLSNSAQDWSRRPQKHVDRNGWMCIFSLFDYSRFLHRLLSFFIDLFSYFLFFCCCCCCYIDIFFPLKNSRSCFSLPTPFHPSDRSVSRSVHSRALLFRLVRRWTYFSCSFFQLSFWFE